MMKWKLSIPPLSSSKKFETKIIIHSLHTSPDTGELSLLNLGVEVKWKGSKKSNNRINFNRRNVKRDLTKAGLVNDGLIVEWNEEFVGVCDLVRLKNRYFCQFDVAFKVFDSSNQGPKRSDNAVATGSLNLAEFAFAEQEKVPINICLSVPGSTECSHILSASLSLQELRTAHNVTKRSQKSVMPLNTDEPSVLKSGFKKVKIFKAISPNRAKNPCREETGVDYPFDTDSLNESDGIDSEEVDFSDFNIKKSLSYGTLTSYFNSSGGEDEDRIYYQSYNTQDGRVKTGDLNVLTIDSSESKILKRSIFSWKKKKLTFRSFKVKGEPLLKRDVGEEGGDDIDFDRRMLTSSDDSSPGWQRSDEGSTTSRSSISEFGDGNFIIGKWENKEFTSRNNHMTLKTQVFFASIDQRSEKASGQSACTSLVATIADWFQNNRHEMPLKSEFDTLIREGSLDWRNLCENEVFKKQFPDKHFDLETILQSKTHNLEIVPEKSFIGFFQLEEGVFNFLDGAMSFDTIWDEISEISQSQISQTESNPLVYIVSWNDHFFILKVEKDAYFIIDTLGERLYEGCNQAYILKFDQETRIQQKSNGKADECFIMSKGKESCKEYIKSFLAEIPLRELQTDVKKGLMTLSSHLVHRRLQIEFHYTKCL